MKLRRVGGVAAALNNLRIESAGTEEEAAQIFMAVQKMDIDEGRGDLVEEEEKGDGTQGALGDL